MNPAGKLKALYNLLPQLSERLDSGDYTALCRRVVRAAGVLEGEPHNQLVEEALDETIARLESRFPRFTSRVRGAIAPETDLSVDDSSEVTKRIAVEVYEDSRLQLAVQRQKEQAERDKWLGLPELQVFDRVSPAMRERAIRIRDWCEERLEFIHSRGEMRYYTAHGIGHSKRVLRFGADLLRAFPDVLCDPFGYFAIYVGAYCHDLGLMLREHEDPESEDEFTQIRRTHGRRTFELLMGRHDRGVPPAWRTMGFASEREAIVVANICAVHQKAEEVNLVRLPRTQSLLVDGDTKEINTQALALVLRLADALDFHEKRLPPVAYLQHREISETSIGEYLKHEIVETVHVADDGTVHVAMRVRYDYPRSMCPDKKVREEIAGELSLIQALLKKSGLILPNPRFNAVEALFPEAHPFLKSG